MRCHRGQRLPLQLLTVYPYEKSSVGTLLLGSVSEKVVRHATGPVTVVGQ
ncbi:universal stress protein [Marinobacter apostichopi]